MNYFSFFNQATILKKTFSVITLLALLAGGLTGLVYTSTAYANNGINTYAVPNTGTLVPGQTMDVHMTVALDPNDTNPVTSPSCLVNGVEVKDTFTIVDPAGHFRFTYTVGESDASRAAGQVPINCTLQQTGSVTVTAFDDGNTVAIDTDEEPAPTPVGPGTDGVTTYFTPNSGTLTNGQNLELHMEVGLDPNDTNPVVSPSCLVNGVDVASTFQNMTSGTAGHFKFTYTVGSSDADRAAGQVPVSCTLQQTGSVTVTEIDGTNAVAIDATASSGGSGNAPQIASVSINPNTGTLEAGYGATVTFQTVDTATTDLVVSGLCHVNAVDVSSTLANIGNGAYQFSYIVGPNDGERPAGHIPVSCTFSNANGSVTATGWTDGNTVAIDTNGDGAIDNGTNNLGFTVTANPSSGTLNVGESVTVSLQDPLPSADVVIGSAGCRVNDEDVASSYAYHGNGLYKVTYTVAEGDADRNAGELPIDCTLENHTGSVHLVAFTDSNTIAVDSSTGNGTGTTTMSVGAVPNTGTLVAGQNLEVYLEADPSANNLTIGGACNVNDVGVAGSFQNLSGGLYKVTYTVGASDADRAAGQVPVSCVLTDGTNNTFVSAFTDGNTVAIDAANDGITPPTGNETPNIAFVTPTPNTGTVTSGGTIEVNIQEGHGMEGFTVGACTINDVNVAGTFQDLGSGSYRVTYTAADGHTDRAAGQVPINCTLNTPSGPVAITSFTGTNNVAIDVGTTGGGSGTTTLSLSSVTATPNTGTVYIGESFQTTLIEASGNANLTVGACTINSVDVAGSFQNLGGGSYQVTYTATEGDTNRGVGTVPINCTLNGSGGQSVTATSFTDGNTLAIYATEDPEYAVAPEISGVSINPSNGTLSASTSSTTATITLATNKTELIMGDVCNVNGVDVRSTFQNIGGGLYTVTYTASSTHSDRTAGNIPFLCTLRKATIASSTTATAFTDGNTLAIDINNDGIFATSTGTSTNGGGNGTTTGTTTDTGGNGTTTVALGPTPGVEPISMVESTATAGGGYAEGWVWIFRITVPESETNLQMKFSNWSATSGTSTIATANNMRVSSAQASSTSAVTITAADAYSSPALVLTGDLDPNMAGRQIEVKVEMQVPAGTANGSYTTNYAIKSF